MKFLKVLAALFLFTVPAFAAVEDFGIYARYSGTGVNDNDVLFTTNDLTRFDSCMLMSISGAVDVQASLDGTNFTTASLSLQDFGGTSTAYVLVTVAGRMYGLVGKFAKLRILQSGGTASNAVMTCWRD